MNLLIPMRRWIGIVVFLLGLGVRGADPLPSDLGAWASGLERDVLEAVARKEPKVIEARLRQELARLPSRLGLEDPEDVLKRSAVILVLCDQHLDSKSLVRMDALEHRARILIDLKRVQTAAPLLNQATALFNQVPEPLEGLSMRITEDMTRLYLCAGTPSKALETLFQPGFNSLRLKPEESVRFRSLIAEAYLDLEARGSESLNRASDLLLEIGDFHEAHPETNPIEKAHILHLMGRSLRMMRKPGEAHLLTEEAVKLRRQILHPSHPDLASSQRQLGELAGMLGAHSNGIAQLTRTLPVLRQHFGPTHLEVLSAYRHLALFHHWSGQAADAKVWVETLVRSENQLIEETVSAEDESALRYRVQRMEPMLVPGILDSRGPDGLALASIRFKGLAAQWMSEKQDTERAKSSHELSAWVDRWNEFVRGRVTTNRIRLWNGEGALAAGSEEVALEKALAGKGLPLGRIRRRLEMSTTSVSGRLSPNTALVDYVDHPEITTPSNAPIRLSAILYLPGKPPKYVDLPRNSEIPKWVLAYSEALQKGASSGTGLLELSRSLRTSLWDPVERQLPSGITNIVLCPVGPLGTIPFASLAGTDSLLGESFSFRYIPSIAQALEPAPAATTNRTAALFSSADFDQKPLDGKSKTHHWKALPASLDEARELERTLSMQGWKTHSSTGSAFTKKAVLSTRSPGILHLGSHGIWQPSVSPYASSPGDREAVRWSMLNNAIIVSGANWLVPPVVDPKPRLSGIWMEIPVRGPDSVPNPEGYLTAGDLESADLRGTWLVVLSGCQTGLGEFEEFEGLYGLQRAALTAGARHVLATAWPVWSSTTSKLIPKVVSDGLESGDLPGALFRRLSEAMRHERIDNQTPLDQVLRRYGPYMLISKSL